MMTTSDFGIFIVSIISPFLGRLFYIFFKILVYNHVYHTYKNRFLLPYIRNAYEFNRYYSLPGNGNDSTESREWLIFT